MKTLEILAGFVIGWFAFNAARQLWTLLREPKRSTGTRNSASPDSTKESEGPK
jgi:hypothetical protein